MSIGFFVLVRGRTSRLGCFLGLYEFCMTCDSLWGGDCTFLVDIADLYCMPWDFCLVAGGGVYIVRVRCLVDFGFLDRYHMSLVVALPRGYRLRVRILVGQCTLVLTLVIQFARVFQRSRIGC